MVQAQDLNVSASEPGRKTRGGTPRGLSASESSSSRLRSAFGGGRSAGKRFCRRGPEDRCAPRQVTGAVAVVWGSPSSAAPRLRGRPDSGWHPPPTTGPEFPDTCDLREPERCSSFLVGVMDVRSESNQSFDLVGPVVPDCVKERSLPIGVGDFQASAPVQEKLPQGGKSQSRTPALPVAVEVPARRQEQLDGVPSPGRRTSEDGRQVSFVRFGCGRQLESLSCSLQPVALLVLQKVGAIF